MEMVQLLLSSDRTDPSADNNRLLYLACHTKNYLLIRQLLKDSRVQKEMRSFLAFYGFYVKDALAEAGSGENV